MSNAGYGNYVEETPAPASSEKSPTKPGGSEDGRQPSSSDRPDVKPAAPASGAAASDRPAGDEVDPGVG